MKMNVPAHEIEYFRFIFRAFTLLLLIVGANIALYIITGLVGLIRGIKTDRKEVNQMNKSVLIIDTPAKCKDCIASDVNLKDVVIKCTITEKETVYNDNCDEELKKECPLHPLPEKRQCNYYDFSCDYFNNIHDRGFNDCLDMISGKGLGSV